MAFESQEVLPQLMESLARFEPNAEVVVVDNASPSGPPVLQHGRLVQLSENIGYGAACNRGVEALRPIQPTHVAFLNPDVRVSGPTVSQLVDGFNCRPGIGIATGPIVDDAGRRVPSAWGEPSWVRAFWYASGLRLRWARRMAGKVMRSGAFLSGASTARTSMPIDGYVIGGAMVARCDCFDSVGGFDGAYFLGWEDADLCLRARTAGWEVWLLDAVPFVHLGTKSSRGVAAESWRNWYMQGAEIYARRNLSPIKGGMLCKALRIGATFGRLLTGLRTAASERWRPGEGRV